MTVEQKIDELRETVIFLAGVVEEQVKVAKITNERAVQT